MALTDRIQADINRVFLNPDHFASEHTWNGTAFKAVSDDEVALKRKNNNVVDVAWDNNTTETMLYVAKDAFPGRVQPNEQGFLDGKSMKILQVQDDMGMLAILFMANVPKGVKL